MIELLAPAKDKICAKAAIDYGADAVYMGASEFGARKNAPNSFSDIKEVVEYAHKFNAKVYVTLNTILTDDEIIRAKELIDKFYEIGVDAIIVQDMGFFELDLPPIALHASTQCDIRDAEKAKFLEDVGFSRLILARELSLEQIKEIKKQTNAELEVFIHGALCVSYSGQCYLSQLIGERSANRGACAQPCRKKYSLMDEDGNYLAKDKYLLCLKDFNASEHLQSLIDAGVTSFKIEGRLKDENYVKNVVAFYRKKLDELGCKKPSSGKVELDFEPVLEKTFNRGFTDYFLKNNNKKQKENIYNFDTPKAINEYLGKVLEVGRDYFVIDKKLNPQDGLCFFENDELTGCLVNKVERNKVYPNNMEGIKTGLPVYRNFDAQLDKILNTSKSKRRIVANIEFKLGEAKIVDEDGNHADIEYVFEEFAQNSQQMSENIVSQLKKSGETDYLVEEVKLNVKEVPFLPISKLNEIRRELIDKLDEQRIKNIRSKKSTEGSAVQIKKTDIAYPQSEIDYRGNVLNKYAKAFYERHGCKVVEEALEGNTKGAGKVAMTTKHCLKNAFGLCGTDKKLYLVDDRNKRYELKFDCDKCEMEIIF